ncbi:MAG: hypothetical protein IPN79_10850 [Saprospiraceae bacterium]|nr:hypothetical protein [Saprospiraceae bacterium]
MDDIIPLDKGLDLIKKTLDTILSIHQVFDSGIREPDANFMDNPIYIDRDIFKYKTFLSRFPYYYSRMDHEIENFGGIQVLVVKYPNKKEANKEKRVILKHFNQFGYDVFTSYISCTVHGNYLRFITISGDDSEFPNELLNTLKVISN